MNLSFALMKVPKFNLFGRLVMLIAMAFFGVTTSSRADLIALYRFENSTTADETSKLGTFSGNTYNGTAVGDAVSLSTDVSGVNGGSKSLSLGGSGDYVTLPISAVNPFDGSQSYTITCWFKQADLAGNNMIILSSARDTSSGNHAMAFFLHNSPEGNLRTDNYFINQNNVGSGLDDNNWHFGAVTYEPGTGFRLRVDNTYSSTVNFDPAIPSISGDTVIIGDTLNTAFPTPGDFAGLLDDVAIFNHKLSDAELDNVKAGDFSAYVTYTPEIDVTGNDLSIVSGDTTPSTTDHTDFGSTIVNGGTITRTFTITNSGGGILNLSGASKVAISGAGASHFSVTQPSFSSGSVSIVNAGFEYPVYSAGGWNYQGGYNFNGDSNAGWTFGTSAGIAGNGSPWFVNSAPEGSQAAFIQNNSVNAYFSQSLSFPAAGVYDVTFYVVRRSSGYPGNDVDVRVDGASIGTVQNTVQTSDTWASYTYYYYCPSAGSHTLSFVGLRGGGDYGSAIDNVTVTRSQSRLGPGESKTFQVQFAPTSTGAQTATLTIANDDSDEGTYAFDITGSASSNSLPSGAVAWWRAENNANDSIGSNNGTLNGGATYTAGHIGNAFSFNTVGDNITVPDSASLDLSGSFTIEAWVYLTNRTSHYMIVTKAPSVGPSNYPGNYELRVTPTTGYLELGFEYSGGLNFWASTTAVPLNQWSHVAVVYTSGTSVEFFVDGVSSGMSSTTRMPLVNNSILRIAARADGYSFNGAIDELALFSRALTSTEIQNIAADSYFVAEWDGATGTGNGVDNGSPDQLRIRRNGTNIEFSGDGGISWTATLPYASTTVLTLTGSSDDDTFVIDFSGGNPIPSGGITVAGGSQVTGDKLQVTGGAFGTVTHNLLTANDGSLVIAGMGTITYTGLEPVDMTGSTITDLVFNLPADPSNAILEDDGTAANGISRFRFSPVTFESTDFTNPSGSLTINRGNASDTLTINATPDFTATLTVGGSGVAFATVTLAGDLSLSSGKDVVVNAGTFNANAGADLATTGSGVITIAADDISINATATLTSVATVGLKPQTGARPIDLGTETAGSLSLTDAELDRVSAGTITFGDSSSGAISVSAAITRASATSLSLTTANNNNIVFNGLGRLSANGGNVTITTGGTGGIGSPGSATADITCDVLTLTSGSGGIGSIITGFAPLLINANSLITSTPNAAQYISETDSLTLTSLNAGNSTIILYNGTFYLTTDSVNDNTLLGIKGTLDVNGQTDTFATLGIGSGGIVTGTGTITANVANESGASAGSIITSGASLTLGNPASSTGYSMSGSITVGSGHLLVLRDSNAASVGNTTVNGTLTAANGISLPLTKTLSGTGIVSGVVSVSSNATIAPGNSGPGILSSGNVTFTSGANFNVGIDGTTAGTGYDRLSVTGTVNLGGATLNISGTHGFTPGDSFIMISNDGVDAVTGTFNGLAEGGQILNLLGSGTIGVISYVGGDGNDVTLTIEGTPQTWTAATGNGNGADNATADTLRIRRNGSEIEFSADGGATWSAIAVYQNTSVLTLQGSGDDDTFVIDFSTGNPIPPDGLVIVGAGQVSAGDSIIINGGSHTTITYGFVNNNDGSIDFDGSLVSYTGLEPITDNSDAVNRVFDFTGGAETITVKSVSATQTFVDSTLGESVTFNNPTSTMTVNAGTGDDKVLFNSLSSGWAATVTLNGGAGDDTFYLNKTVSTSAAITLNGDAHTTSDVLNFDREGDTAITSSGASPGTVSGGLPAIQTVNYDTVETINMYLYGSPGDYVIADRGPYFSTGTILLYKAASGLQQVVDTTIKDPYEISLDSSGNFVIADYEVNAGTAGIYLIDRLTGTKSTVSSDGDFEVPFGVKADTSGGVNDGKYIVADLDADNNGASAWGALFVVDPGSASPGNQTLLSSRTAGTGTFFYWLTGLALGGSGDIYVCDQGNLSSPGTQPPRVFHVDPTTGNRTVMAQGGTMVRPVGVVVISGTGNTAELLVVDAGSKKLLRFTGTGSPITISGTEELSHSGVTFDSPTHVAINSSGNYIITDAPAGAVAGQRRIHVMDSGTLVTTTVTSDGFLEQPRGVHVVP